MTLRLHWSTPAARWSSAKYEGIAGNRDARVLPHHRGLEGLINDPTSTNPSASTRACAWRASC
jgi:hypothetical protein